MVLYITKRARPRRLPVRAEKGGTPMKKLSWLLVLAMVLLPLCAVTASAEGTYTQAPMFDALV